MLEKDDHDEDADNDNDDDDDGCIQAHFGSGWGGAKMTTLLCRHPNNISRRAVLLGIYSTFVMSDNLIQSLNLHLDFATSTLGFRMAFCENSVFRG